MHKRPLPDTQQNNPMQPVSITITTKDKDQARSIGTTLVKERLVACANILDSMNSIYFWEGILCDETESLLICKTVADLIDPVTVRVTQLHTYTTPCIIAMPIIGGNQAFLDWIYGEIRQL